MVAIRGIRYIRSGGHGMGKVEKVKIESRRPVFHDINLCTIFNGKVFSSFELIVHSW
jgi:hypothetical protein